MNWWNLGKLVTDALGAGLVAFGAGHEAGAEPATALVSAVIAALTAVVQRQRMPTVVR